MEALGLVPSPALGQDFAYPTCCEGMPFYQARTLDDRWPGWPFVTALLNQFGGRGEPGGLVLDWFILTVNTGGVFSEESDSVRKNGLMLGALCAG